MIVNVARTKKITSSFIESMRQRHYVEVWQAQVHLMDKGPKVDSLSNFAFDKVVQEVCTAISKIKEANGNKLESKGIAYIQNTDYVTASPTIEGSWGKLVVTVVRASKKLKKSVREANSEKLAKITKKNKKRSSTNN